MKIGIYNRYWNTCGGGEKYIGSIAEALSQDHDVELISIEIVNWDQIQSRLCLNLSRCSTIQWPDESCHILAPLSSKYDLFINSTYCSSMLPYSAKSVFICFFPHQVNAFSQLKSKSLEWIKKQLLRLERKVLHHKSNKYLVKIDSGLFSTEQDGRAWAGTKLKFSIVGEWPKMIRIPLMPNCHHKIFRVILDSRELSWKIIGNELCIEVLPILDSSNTFTIYSNPLNSLEMGNSQDSRELGFCIDYRNEQSFRRFSNQDATEFYDDPLTAISKYDRIISISQFTSEWIDKRWHLPSTLLTPPVDTNEPHISSLHTKEKIILSVGRFFAGGHNKKHHEMARAFIKMRSQERIPKDWRLVFIGSRHLEHSSHLSYFEKLKEICAGHPIDIFPDLPSLDLRRYYLKAAIYWHAAGWGEDIDKHPERFEHFGITTCEAMANRCVPIVFDAAGQREIVNSNGVGFRYSNYKEVAEHMETLTNMPISEILEIGNKARSSILRYSNSEFPDRVNKALNGLGL
jgi:glycosyltransferase involved in cell wall biosynthesis